MNFLKLTRESLCIDDITKLVAHSSCGAVSLFSGFTRDNFENKKVISLEYEAYESMAIKRMEIIGSSIRKHWPDVVNIAIYHRLGVVPVCEASIVIAISAPHRKSSLEAVNYAIDEFKTTVPIWKKEQYQDNESVWKENKECQWFSKDREESSCI